MKQQRFPQELEFPPIEPDEGLKAVIEYREFEILLKILNSQDELIDIYKLQKVIIE